jgi:hypothetical protein
MCIPKKKRLEEDIFEPTPIKQMQPIPVDVQHSEEPLLLPRQSLPRPIIIDRNFEERAVKILESRKRPAEEIEKLKENLVGFRDAIQDMNDGKLSYSEMRSRYG